MTNNEAIGILEIVVETAKGRCFVTDEAISDAYAMAIKALEAQDVPDTNVGDTISRQAAYIALVEKGWASRRYKLGETWELNGKEIREVLDALQPAQPQYTELTPEEAASEIANGSIMSASYWLDAMIRLKQMGYAICRKKG